MNADAVEPRARSATEEPLAWSATELLDPPGLAALQVRRLRALLAYLEKNSAFHRQRFAAAGVRAGDVRSLADYRRLPFLRKADVEGDTSADAPPPFYRGLFVGRHEDVQRWHRTSGTTGIPVRVGDTDSDWQHYSDVSAEAFYAMGIRKRDTVVVPFGHGPFIGFWTYITGLEQMGAAFVASGSLDARARLELMRDFGATVLVSTPSYALHLAEVAREIGMDLRRSCPVRLVITTGEALTGDTKANLLDAWNTTTLDRIGSAETGGIAYECPHAPGTYHLHETYIIAEVLDPKTDEPVAPGEQGELVVTQLYRRGMPLLRFRTGNIVELAPSGQCRCGRWYRSLANTPNGVVQRRADLLVKVRGVLVDPAAVERIVRALPECGEGWQVAIERVGQLDEITVNAELRQPLPEAGRAELGRRLESDLRRAMNLRVNVRLFDLGGLGLDGGKVKRVVDRRRAEEKG